MTDVENAITRDRLRSALSRYENRPADEHSAGTVKAVNADGSYEVLLDGDVQPRTCSAGCTAGVGDRVLVCIMANGRCVAVSRLEGEIAEIKKNLSVQGLIVIPNGRGYATLNPDGEIRTLAYMGTSGKMVFGYDSYSKSEDTTFYYGNAVDIVSKEGVGVTGDLTLKNALRMPNAVYMSNADTGGIYRNVIGTNTSNNLLIGYGGYSAAQGGSYLYGNAVGIRSKGEFNITSPTAGLSARAYGVNKVLASPGMFMNADHTVTLSEAVSAQPNGIVLVWSWYSASGGASNSCFKHFFVPKHQVSAHNTCGVDCARIAYDGNMAKYVYVHDTKITGHSLNIETNTTGGCTYNNKNYVLRYVLGV